MPKRLYSASDVAAAWGVSTERVRQLVRAGSVVPDFVHQTSTYKVQVFWLEIPERGNGLRFLLDEMLEEE